MSQIWILTTTARSFQVGCEKKGKRKRWKNACFVVSPFCLAFAGKRAKRDSDLHISFSSNFMQNCTTTADQKPGQDDVSETTCSS